MQYKKIIRYCQTPKQLFVLAFVLALLVTLHTVIHHHDVFLIYRDGTMAFWNGINPYTDPALAKRVYVYGPLFSILFAPFAWAGETFGVLAWNMFNAVLFVGAIFRLPNIAQKQKKLVYWFILLMLGQALFSNQYNTMAAALFLLAYIFLEKNKFFWAILLICISGFIKLYGFVELLLLLLYPNKIKNAIYFVVICVALFISPIVKIPFAELNYYYKTWMGVVAGRGSWNLGNSGLNTLSLLFSNVVAYKRGIQLGLLFIIVCLVLLYAKRVTATRKTYMLALTMVFIILFSEAAEWQTHLISLVGYVYWYAFLKENGKATMFDKVLLWCVFATMVVMPIDIFFQPTGMIG